MKSCTLTRRQFVHQTVASTAAVLAAPAVITPSRTDKETIVGQGDYRYVVDHDFLQLPGNYSWQTTHNVAVDKAGNIYVIHEGRLQKKDHPAIFVFDNQGKFIRAFGSQFQGGGHGLEVREENGEEFLYATAYQSLKFFSKMSLNGEQVWTRYAPMGSKVYAKSEDTERTGTWGRDRFMPTNFAFLDDGGFLVADGYGAWVIHHYDADGKYLRTFGKPGKGAGEFNTPHGIWIDHRDSQQGPLVVVADRANMRLQWMTLEGKHVRTQDGFLLPANIDVRGDLLLVPELQARISLLGPDNQVVAVLGEDPEWRKKVMEKGFPLRGQPQNWQSGKFLHPHDACFDADGNILVAEWVQGGRVTKLKRV